MLVSSRSTTRKERTVAAVKKYEVKIDGNSTVLKLTAEEAKAYPGAKEVGASTPKTTATKKTTARNKARTTKK